MQIPYVPSNLGIFINIRNLRSLYSLYSWVIFLFSEKHEQYSRHTLDIFVVVRYDIHINMNKFESIRISSVIWTEGLYKEP